jgi:hypothetical protein
MSDRLSSAPRVHSGGRALETSPIIAIALVAFSFFLIISVAIDIPELGDAPINDFDAFYIVGLLIHEGRLAEAYHLPTMLVAQRDLAGAENFMPWTYPPPFDLVVAVLPVLPRGMSYALFTGATLMAYLVVLHWLAGRHLTAVLIVTKPIILTTLLCGQNGFLTGALVGGFCLAILNRRSGAGLPLGLMVIKPHLAIGLGIWTLVAGRWAVVMQAVLVALALMALSTLAFGFEVWVAFRSGVAEAGQWLASGLYPLHRMTSLYAALYWAGLSPELAMVAQSALALAACGLIVVAVRRGFKTRLVLALACGMSLLISPYSYDYDLTIFGVGLALAAGDLLARASVAQKIMLVGLAWFAGGWGLVRSVMTTTVTTDGRLIVESEIASLAGPAFLAVLIVCIHVLRSGAPEPPEVRAV